MKHPFDICVRGGGIVGHTLALLLAREQLRVALVDGQRSTASAADVRAYALNAKSRTLLESVRCWPDDQHTTAVTQMQIAGDAGGVVHFSAAALDVPALAWIVDVTSLTARLAEAVRFQPQIELLDEPVAADLMLVCEGKNSPTRAQLGVDFALCRYGQSAIATRLSTEQPHDQIARQWFDKDQILAFLPLDGASGHGVAVVWSVPEQRLPALLAASDEDFCAELEQVSQQALGRVQISSQRLAWPLHAALASRWIGATAEGQAWALVGDSAHTVHPLAGQGLNLGLGDVLELVRILSQRPSWRAVSDLRLLRQYERNRRTAVGMAAFAMDGLQRLFYSPGVACQSLRNWGMNGFERSACVKQWVARYAMGL